jgi:hypothetical protein
VIYPNCGNVRGPHSWGGGQKKNGLCDENVAASRRDAGKTPRKKIQSFVLAKGHEKKNARVLFSFTGASGHSPRAMLKRGRSSGKKGSLCSENLTEPRPGVALTGG